MKAPFATRDLDALMNACIAYTRDHDPDFYAGDVMGHQGVTDDQDVVARMILWIGETDRGLIQDRGLGKYDIHYYRLGHDAIEMMQRGGFEAYLRRRTWRERLEGVRLWTPIIVALIALAVSIAALGVRMVAAGNASDLRAQVLQLQVEQEQLRAAVGRWTNAGGPPPRSASTATPAASASPPPPKGGG